MALPILLNMRETKIFAAVFGLTILVAVLLMSIAISVNGSRINFFPGTDSGSGSSGAAILLGCIVGAINGLPVGLLSMLYLRIWFTSFSQQNVPLWPTTLYSLSIGLAEFLFFTRQFSNLYETFGSLLSDLWQGLLVIGVIGFLIAFLPFVLAKRIFDF